MCDSCHSHLDLRVSFNLSDIIVTKIISFIMSQGTSESSFKRKVLELDILQMVNELTYKKRTM